ncbi:Zn-dependent exopeptidase [Neoconidiobolus thromboides FSU 785]|nr:Zn-dependent exopeptidase [Neoconidiobolus thromboides FSU 785]
MKFHLLSLVAISAAVSKPSQGDLSEGNRLVKTSLNGAPKWLNYDQVSELIKEGTHFIDITDDKEDNVGIQRSSIKSVLDTEFEVPSDIRYWDLVRKGIQHISKTKAKSLLTTLSSYHNRYYNASTGVQSAEWIHNQAKLSIDKLGNGANIKFFNHTWPQPSVIATIPGSDLKDEVVIIGAHLDSINRTERATGRAPGADDDGTGTVSLLQALNALAQINFKPRRTLQFQWYAAEEVGLRGSRAIAKEYRDKNVNVVTQLQLDMNGHLVNRQIRIVNDFTDPELNALVKRLIEAYTEYYWVDGKCGYGCSDHASWNEQGYRSAFPLEDKSTPYIHTENDTVANVNFDHWYQFARLGLAYTIELSEPRN